MELFPAVPLRDWADTKETLHRFLQVVGKIRLTSAPRRNHWWNASFHLCGNGITTRPMGVVDGNPVFTVDFDFVDHLLVARTIHGRSASFLLPGHSVSTFYREVLATLDGLGVHARIPNPRPYDLPDSGRPFVEDIEHAHYDPAAVNRYWRVLSQVGMVLEAFAAEFSGKTSPVHHFWHTFDLAMTRFGDRVVAQPRDAGPLIREAYSRDAISFGFWFGDESVGEPAFYSYTAPEPEGITDRPLPIGAHWTPSGKGHLALLPCAEAHRAPDPRSAVLSFYEAAYQAGAELLGWDRAALASPGGVTDPHHATS
ncbi:hypothetical protein CDO52_26720 [Nocardiopsis gilva YIM 90087]|uniref:Ava_C0101 and related proteins n=1 Tax=Nocardiopsis gilva YIM 90087 TaxID=1235441 RepID=A0A223SCV0_9ACTN|nr:DUF5996 family protein [Nocardiopsis gilva]ASU85915.1 hypothetical protein CDO52_26720 [Nocardiopsis gilva YIM 90087]